ncbi:MAG: hypothetical protein ACOWWM_20450 [Desulfobacterales bacterium]
MGQPTGTDEFARICRRISLNLPPDCRWRWDDRYNLALVVFNQEDFDLIYMPILLEFENRWDFSTLANACPAVRDIAAKGFGMMPGQEIFATGHGEDNGSYLFAALWPWGDDNSYSLRVGLVSRQLSLEDARSLLSDWLDIR